MNINLLNTITLDRKPGIFFGRESSNSNEYAVKTKKKKKLIYIRISIFNTCKIFLLKRKERFVWSRDLLISPTENKRDYQSSSEQLSRFFFFNFYLHLFRCFIFKLSYLLSTIVRKIGLLLKMFDIQKLI